MIKINLLPSAKRAKPRKRKVPAISPVAVIGGVIQILFVMLVIGIIHIQVERKRKQIQFEIRDYEEKLTMLNAPILRIKSYEEQTDELRKKLEIIDNLKKAQQGPVRLMEEVSLMVPEKVWLKEMENMGDRLKVKGYAVESGHVSDFMQNLDRSEYFKDVVLEEVASEGVRGGFSVNSFTLNMVVETKTQQETK